MYVIFFQIGNLFLRNTTLEMYLKIHIFISVWSILLDRLQNVLMGGKRVTDIC